MKDRTLPPWDALQWFQTVNARFFTLTGGDDVPVKADPQRVYLMFSVGTGAANVQVWPATIGNTVKGLTVGPLDPREFLQAWHGPLVACEWHAFGAPAGVLGIIEVSLRGWPGPGQGDLGG